MLSVGRNVVISAMLDKVFFPFICANSVPFYDVAVIIVLNNRDSSDGQIQIVIRFKSRLNHLWRFDLSSKRFGLNVHDSIGIRFEIHGDSI